MLGKGLWLLLAFSLAACGGLGGEPQIIATVAWAAPPTDANPQAKPDIAQGARIFAEHCASCHGISGDGKGELVLAGSIPQPIDMTRLELTRRKRPQDWYEIITDGSIEKLMPPWRDALTRQQRWDVALYAYSLGYDEALLQSGERIWAEKCAECSPIKPFSDLESSLAISDADYGAQINREDFAAALTPEEVPAVVAYARMQSLMNPTNRAPIGSFTGQVRHGTAGGSLPADTVVQLQYGNPELGFSFAETTLDEDFSFTFEDIPLTADFTYTVGAVYLDRLFARRLPAGNPAHQSLAVYDLTHDPSVVSVSRIELFIEAVRLNDLGSGLYVSQIIRYRNSSDHLYTSGRGFDDGREASLLIQLPAGARIMSGDENGRYIIVEDLENVPDSVIDTLPVVPGDSHEVRVEYFVPYVDGLMLEQAFSNAIGGEITVTLSDSLRVISDSLNAESSPDDRLLVFSGRLNSSLLAFEIVGNPFVTSSDDQNAITGDVLPPLLLGIAGLAAAAMAGLIVQGRRQDKSRRIDILIGQIAQLDEKHDRGQINHDLYQRQRRALKEQLGQLMPPEQDE